MSRLPIAQPISRPSSNGSVHINMKEIERQRQAQNDIDPDDLDDDIDDDDDGSDYDRREDPFTTLSSSISQRIVVASKCLVISSKIIKQLQTSQSRNNHHMTRQEQQDDTHIQQSLRDSVTEAHTVIGQMEPLMLQFQQLPLEGTKQQQSDRRLQRSRLVKDYTDVTKKAKQISTLAKQLTTINHNGNGNGKQSREVDEDSETTSLLATNSYQQSQMMDDDTHLTEQELAEQEEQARRKHQFMLDIERDVVHVHEMFRDLNGLVHTQQSAIDSIEAGISETSAKTRMGLDQLLQAEQHMKAKRKNTCCLMLLGVLVVLIVVLFFWVVFG